MTLRSYLETMCQYNRWANERLYALVATVPDSVRKHNAGASFGSIHGVLNHMLLADKIWLGRFLGEPFAVTSLAQELYSDFDALRHEREATDAAVDKWAWSLDEEALIVPLTFQSATFGREFTLPMEVCVIHFFNHQTHHRGQLTTLLHQASYDVPNTDLMWLPVRDVLPEL